MSCEICGNERGIYSVFGFDGNVCQECNDYLVKLNYGHAAEAKVHFDNVTSNRELSKETVRFL